MEFSKTQFFKVSPIGADEKALRAIAAELSRSGECTFAHYQDRFPSLDALLAGRPLPLDRLELDAPAATVLIERHGVTVHHLPDADDVEALREVLQRFTIPPLARCGLLCQLVLIGLVLIAWLKSDFSFMVLVFVVSALLDHVLNTLAIPDPVVRLPWGMGSDQQRVQIGLGIAVVVLFVAVEAFRILSN